MKTEITITEKKGIAEFWYIICKIYQKTVHGLIQKYKDKLQINVKVGHLMDNWNLLGIYNKITDATVCVIQNIEKKVVYIESNAHNYLIRPYEHSNKFHREKEQILKKFGQLFTSNISCIVGITLCWYFIIFVPLYLFLYFLLSFLYFYLFPIICYMILQRQIICIAICTKSTF